MTAFAGWCEVPPPRLRTLRATRPRALLHGRFNVAAEDVRAIAHPVLRHRIYTNFNADAEGVSPDNIIDMLIKAVPEPRGEDYKNAEEPARA